MALHLLDIAHNSVSAKARNITISVDEDSQADLLRMFVEDDGAGMDAEAVATVIDPFVTSRKTRSVGLGIPLLKAAAEATGGGLTIRSTPKIGTRIEVTFGRSHIDRMPLGDLADTYLSLLVGCPEVHWRFHYVVDGRSFDFDDEPVKRELEGVAFSEPAILGYLRELFETGISEVQCTAASA